MNHRYTTALLPLVLAASVFAGDKPKAKEPLVTLQGNIMDSQCAFNVHSQSRSHEWMIKKGVQDASDEKSCTLHCVKDLGGSYVLMVKKDVYRLDDQAKAEPFAGKDVKVSGTVDAKTHMVHVIDISESK